MRVRELRASDLPALRAMHERAGFAYEFPELAMLEAAAVVVDENDQPLMAAAAERIVQLYLFVEPRTTTSCALHPAARLHAIRLLHRALAEALRARGYREANAFLPPGIERSFGRRLMRTFGWIRNWTSYAIHF